MNIGQRIQLRRIELGLSVNQLATKLQINRATIYRYENNSIEKLPTSVLEPLAHALKTTPAFLMGWETIQPENQVQNKNLVTAIGRGGERTTYELSDSEAELVNSLLEELRKKK